MPNWIEGTLKLRGESKDLKGFFDTVVQPPACYFREPYKKEDFIKCEYGDEDNLVEMKEDAWIEGTQRAFVNEDCFVEFGDGFETVCIPIRQAWTFVAENWKNISEKYNLDVRLYGFERGMEFSKEVEVIDGKITIDNEKKYEDWDWDCPMPLMGG